MNLKETSHKAKNLIQPNGEQDGQQIQWPLQAFLNWIDSVEIQNDLATQSGPTQQRISQRNIISSTNGPYAEIKELIGNCLHDKKK